MDSLDSREVPDPPTTPCTLWTGRIRDDGYGTLGVRMAHRAIWEDVNGPVPKGLELDHLCRVRHCVRPDHLEPVTHEENLRRANFWRVLQETCVNGHTGEYRWQTNGTRKRYCAGCKRDRARVENVRKVLGDPCPKGHAYDRQTGAGVRCSVCMSASGKKGMQIRWHG